MSGVKTHTATTYDASYRDTSATVPNAFVKVGMRMDRWIASSGLTLLDRCRGIAQQLAAKAAAHGVALRTAEAHLHYF